MYLEKAYRAEYTTPFGGEPIFEPIDSINILSLRDNRAVSLFIKNLKFELATRFKTTSR